MTESVPAQVSRLVESLGWTLLHSVWQLAFIALVVAVLLQSLRNGSARARYVIAMSGLVLMLVAPCVTILSLQRQTDVGRPGSSGQPRPIEAATGHSIPAVGPLSEVGPQFVAVDRIVESESVPVPGESSASTQAASDQSLVLDALRGFLNPWLVPLSCSWLLGILFLSIRNAGGWLGMWRLKRTAQTQLDPNVAASLSRVVRHVGFRRTMRVLQSSRVQVPVVIGWLRPLILMPVGIAAGLSPDQLDAIVAHELAHIRRHDWLANLFQVVVETLLFHHPAVWWLSQRVRFERELCCDDESVSVCRDSVAYAEALTILEQRRSAPRLLVAATGSSRTGGETMRRVRRLLGQPVQDHGLARVMAGMLVLSAGGLLACLTLAEEPERDPSEASARRQGELERLPAAASVSEDRDPPPAQPDPSRLLYEAGGGTLPINHGFHLLDSSREHGVPVVKDGALRLGPTTGEGWQYWWASGMPIDFSAEGPGIAVEWIARVESSSQYNVINEYRAGFGIYVSDAARRHFSIFVAEDQVVMMNREIDAAPPAHEMDTTDVFHHYRFVVDDSQGKLFVDGGQAPVLRLGLGASSPENYRPNDFAIGDTTILASSEGWIKAIYFDTDARSRSPFHPE